MTSALLSLGSNLDDRVAYIQGAVAALGSRLLAASGVYETPPWADPDQPNYLNAMVLATTDAPEHRTWLDLATELENAAGRVRDPERRFGPRTLDVDIIMVYGHDGVPVISADPELTLPHPRAHQRAFVLRPWLDLHPDPVLTGYGPVRELLRIRETAADLRLMRYRADIALRGRRKRRPGLGG